jgi:hypothetical protein
MAEAVNYVLGQWEELNVFCSDGAVPIDNNVSTAARGSADVMPTPGLCRVGRFPNPPAAHFDLADAA